MPVVTVASAAPALAVSPDPCVGSACLNLTGNACKHPGEPKWYHFEVCIENSSVTDDVTVTFDYMTVNGVTGAQTLPGGVTVAPGSTVCTSVDSGPYGDSANGSATLFFSVDGVQGSVSTAFNSLPPCGTGNDPWNKLQHKDNPPHTGSNRAGTSEEDAKESTDEATPESVENTTDEPAVESPAAEEPAPEAPSVEEPATDEAPAGADTASTTASPDNG